MLRHSATEKSTISRIRRLAPGIAAAMALALSGCTAAADGAATPGGIVRIGTTSDLTPSLFFSGTKPSEQTLTGLVYDTLVDYPADSLEPQPGLARSWEVSEDGRTITLELRDDVTFHDGREFTSEDVRFSLETYSDPTHAGQLARVAQTIEEYDTTAPHRLTLTLSQQANNIFDLFAIVPIIDRESYEEWLTGDSYNGTGAFEFTSWTPGSRVEFTANQDYWEGAPKVDGAELLIIPDAQTRFSQLRSGQIDVLTDAAPRDVVNVDNDPAFRVLSLGGTSPMVYTGVNVTAPGLEDVRVRQAINLAVDRERIVADVFQGRARATSLPWPEYSPAYRAEADNPDRDLERARQLIDEVEAESGPLPVIPLNYAATTQEHQTIAQILADNLADLGVEVSLEPLEYTAMVANLRDSAFPGLWVLGHGFSQYQPATLVTSAFPFNSARNSSNFLDADYSADVDLAWRTADPADAGALDAYQAINDHLLDNSFVIEIVARDSEIITDADLQDIGWSKRGELDLTDAHFTR